ncbi:MAG: iron chelate uptake ABC transporter family permease subunit [Sphaerochaetaceae bacterium]|nr:iron chelate uptake ABC transporter family permease subunit [Sphaerochaetaceae bacterium]
MMINYINLLLLPPVTKGLIAMIFAGLCFPNVGVMVLRLDLVPLRYMLMHGVILGGALALASKLPNLPCVIVINLILSFVMVKISGNKKKSLGISSAALMVFSMGLASLLVGLFNVPAKDTLQILWGSPFALSWADVISIALVTIIVFGYTITNFNNISAVFFDQDIASSLGINVNFHYYAMVLLIALIIGFAMKIIGALLIDALLILPVLIATKRATSLKKVFILSTVFGFILSVGGYLIAVALNLPVSGTISILAVIIFILTKKKEQ